MTLLRRQRCRFDFEAKRRREITLHALHVEAAKTEDFDRWLFAWQWHNPKAAEPVWSLMEAAKRMGADISEADAVELTQQASAYPKRLSADATWAFPTPSEKSCDLPPSVASMSKNAPARNCANGKTASIKSGNAAQ